MGFKLKEMALGFSPELRARLKPPTPKKLPKIS